MTNENPHFVRLCRLDRQIHEQELWDAPDEVADPVYEEADFHWECLTPETRPPADFSRMLHAAMGRADPEWKTKEDFVAYLQGTYKHMLMRERGADEVEMESLLDQMDVHWYKLDESELELVRLFASLLNLTEKKHGQIQQ